MKYAYLFVSSLDLLTAVSLNKILQNIFIRVRFERGYRAQQVVHFFGFCAAPTEKMKIMRPSASFCDHSFRNGGQLKSRYEKEFANPISCM